MKLSIIGAGTMGSVYAGNVAKMPGVQPAGVCDLDESRARKAADVCGTNAYTSVDDMLAAERPDVVCVCLPTYLHKEYVLKLAAQGIHVICEKPIALNAEDAKEMQEACERSGVRLFIGHVVRFFPNYADALKQARSGHIGKAGMMHLKRYGSYPQGFDGWYADMGKSGGVVMDLMIHDIDFACAAMGKPESVFAKISRAEGMDYAQVTLKFSEGRMASLTAFWGYPGPFTTQFEIVGTQGVVRFDSNAVQSLDIKVKACEAGAGEAVQVPSSPANHDPYYYEVKHFVECIQSGEQAIVTVDDARLAVAVALAAEQSNKLGQPVEVSI